jgi:hypothetical protein
MSGDACTAFAASPIGLSGKWVHTDEQRMQPKHEGGPGENHPVLRDRLSKKPIRKLEVLAADGRRLRHTDTMLMPQH